MADEALRQLEIVRNGETGQRRTGARRIECAHTAVNTGIVQRGDHLGHGRLGVVEGEMRGQIIGVLAGQLEIVFGLLLQDARRLASRSQRGDGPGRGRCRIGTRALNGLLRTISAGGWHGLLHVEQVASANGQPERQRRGQRRDIAEPSPAVRNTADDTHTVVVRA
jgi:hypothetical protein